MGGVWTQEYPLQSNNQRMNEHLSKTFTKLYYIEE